MTPRKPMQIVRSGNREDPPGGRRPQRPYADRQAPRTPQHLVIGRQPVLEALREGKTIERIFLLKSAEGDIIPELRAAAHDRQVPVNLVPVEKLNSLTRANHQGVVAVTGALTYIDLQDAIDKVVADGAVPLFLILDGVTDVRNIGAIARTALCCGAQAIIIPDKGVGALQEDAIKASAGALGRISVCRVNSLLKALDTLHLNGFRVYASEMKGETVVQNLDFSGPVCCILGSED
ncbi:MAG: RNA methyltransferase, partial [Chitinophagaceae bacterium]|nr:RNA methyltransferase [Chitinophagaceae bacterium]